MRRFNPGQSNDTGLRMTGENPLPPSTGRHGPHRIEAGHHGSRRVKVTGLAVNRSTVGSIPTAATELPHQVVAPARGRAPGGSVLIRDHADWTKRCREEPVTALPGYLTERQGTGLQIQPTGFDSRNNLQALQLRKAPGIPGRHGSTPWQCNLLHWCSWQHDRFWSCRSRFEPSVESLG